MSDRVCIVCEAPYGQPHKINCPRYIHPRIEQLDSANQRIAELEKENARLREEVSTVKRVYNQLFDACKQEQQRAEAAEKERDELKNGAYVDLCGNGCSPYHKLMDEQRRLRLSIEGYRQGAIELRLERDELRDRLKAAEKELGQFRDAQPPI